MASLKTGFDQPNLAKVIPNYEKANLLTKPIGCIVEKRLNFMEAPYGLKKITLLF